MVDRVKDEARLSFQKDHAKAFAKWFIKLYFNLNNNSIKISDGSGDGKVDSFFKADDGMKNRYILINSKFTDSFNINAPVKFYDEIRTFCDAFQNSDVRSAYLRTIRTGFRQEYKNFFNAYDDGAADLYFITNHRKNVKQYEAIQNNNVHVLHLEDILLYMIDNIEGAMPRTRDLILTEINQVLSPTQNDTNNVATSIVFAKLSDFVKYMKDDPYQLLFSRNIRLDLSETDVNKEIKKTFEKQPEEFAFSNNGITMICEKHTHSSGRGQLSIVNPRVVNGAQTLHSVFRATAQSNQARVMVKIIEIQPPRDDFFDKDINKRKEIINKISLRTNRQNSILRSDLVANDEVHHQIALYFHRKNYYYERRRNEWKIRKMDLQSVGIDKGPTLQNLIQLGACYFADTIGPAKARSGVKHLFDEPHYSKIITLKPNMFYTLFQIHKMISQSAARVASSTSKRNKTMFKYVIFVMVSLFIKGYKSLDKNVFEYDFTYGNYDQKLLDNYTKEIYIHINTHLNKLRIRTKDNDLTIINYSKNSTHMHALISIPLRNRAKQLLRSSFNTPA